jgi:hypothetical protein
MSTRTRILAFGLAALLIVVGVVGDIAFDDTVAQVSALVLIGLGFVLATSLVFLEVGFSEDRERAREEARRREREQRPARPQRRRPRLDRMRGRSRRLP